MGENFKFGIFGIFGELLKSMSPTYVVVKWYKFVFLIIN